MAQQISMLGAASQRTEKQLKKKIRDLKSNARKWLSGSKRPPTGGGKPPKKPWYADVLIDEIIGHDSTTLKGFGGRTEAASLFGSIPNSLQAHRKEDSPDTCDQIAAIDDSPPPLPSLELDVCVSTPLPHRQPPTAAITPTANNNQGSLPLPHVHLPTTTFTPTPNVRKGLAEKGTTNEPAVSARLTSCSKRAARATSARRAIEVDDDDDDEADTPYAGHRLQQDRKPYKRLLSLEIERSKLKLKEARESQETKEIAMKRQKLLLEIDEEKLKNLKLKNLKLELEITRMQQTAENVQFLTIPAPQHEELPSKHEVFNTYG